MRKGGEFGMKEQIEKLEHGLMICEATGTELVHVEKADAEKIIVLLKEQEAVRPRRIDGKRNHFVKCGNCNYDLMAGFKFCPHCGKAVKRE